MKKIITIAILILHITSFGQTILKGEGSFTGSPELYSVTGTEPTQQLVSGNQYLLQFGFVNNSTVDRIPSYNTEIRIKLGTLLTVESIIGLVTPNAGSGDFFTWHATTVNGQTEIVGYQKFGSLGDIPSGSAFPLSFTVKAINAGLSEIEASIIYRNYNFYYQNNDPVIENNAASSNYSVLSALPVKFLSISAMNNDCIAKALWTVAEEMNVHHYLLQSSIDGSQWQTQATILAGGKAKYNASFSITPQNRNAALLIRIQAVDVDGKETLSNITRVNTLCTNAGAINIYPNPVAANELKISSVTSFPNGSIITIYNTDGRKFLQQIIKGGSTHVLTLQLPASIIPGVYHLQVTMPPGSIQKATFLKL